LDTVLNVLHVVTAVFFIGPMAVLPMTALRAVRAGQGAQVAILAKSTFVFSLLSLLVVFFGFGVMGMADDEWNLSVATPWILYSIILYVAALVLNLAMVVPAMRRAAARLQSGDALGREYSLIAMGSGLGSLLLLAVVVLMVWKP
jgi:uncharacterized membrane protein